MAKENPKSKSESKSKSKSRAQVEERRRELANSRGAEAITVAWMLSILITGLSTGVSITTALVVKLSSAQWPMTFQVLPGLMLAISMMTGVVTLFLTWLTHRLRSDTPPRAITTFAVVTSLIPVATMVGLMFASQ